MSKDEERLIKDSLSAILLGYSIARWRDKRIFIKHFGHCDSIETDFHYETAFNECIEKKIYTEKQKLELSEKDGLWSADNDIKISTLKGSISNLILTRDKTPLPSQKKIIIKQIEDFNTELNGLLRKRASLLGVTAESIANQRAEDFYIFKSFYIDSSFSQQLFSDEEFDEIEDDQMEELKQVYFNALRYILNNNLRKIALSSSFMSLMYLTENSYEILSKPLALYTFYQLDLITYGKVYKNALSGDPRPPENIRQNPDELDKWINKINDVRQIDTKSVLDNELSGKMLVGATTEDVKEIFKNENVINIGDEIKKKGGMSMAEMIKLHGQ